MQHISNALSINISKNKRHVGKIYQRTIYSHNPRRMGEIILCTNINTIRTMLAFMPPFFANVIREPAKETPMNVVDTTVYDIPKIVEIITPDLRAKNNKEVDKYN